MVSGNRLYEELRVSVLEAPHVGGLRQPSTATPPFLACNPSTPQLFAALLPSCPCMPAASTSVMSPLRARAQLQLSPRWGPSHALSFVVRHVDAAARSQTSRLVAMVSGNRLCEELGVSVHVAPYVGGPRQPSTATPPTISICLRVFRSSLVIHLELPYMRPCRTAWARC
jgi:hypothetical protein